MNNINEITEVSSPCRNYCQQVGRCLLADIATRRADIDVLRSIEIPMQQENAQYYENPYWRQTYGELIDDVNQEVMDELNSPLAHTLDENGVQMVNRTEEFEISMDLPVFGVCDSRSYIGAFGIGIIVTTNFVSGVAEEEPIALDARGNELDLSSITAESIENWHREYISSAVYINEKALQQIRLVREGVVVNQYNWIEPELEKGSIETYVRPVETERIRNDGDIWDNVLEIHEFFTVSGENSFNQVDNEQFIEHLVYLGHRYRDADMSDTDTAKFDEDSNWLPLGVKGEQDSPYGIVFDSRDEMQRFIELAVEIADVEQKSMEFFRELSDEATVRGIVFEVHGE